MKKIYVIFILFMSLFFFGGCGIKDSDNKNVKVETRELTDIERTSLMEIVDKLSYMDFYDKNIVPKNLTNQEALRIAYEIVVSDGNTGSISFSTLEDVAMKYLGFSLEPENLNCDTHFNIQDSSGADILVYDVNTGNYKKNISHVSHSTKGVKTKVYNEYFDGYVENDKYVVVVYKVFSELIGNNTANKLNYYSNYNDAKNSTNVILNTNDIAGEFVKLDKDRINKYTYEFKLKDKDYILLRYIINE